MSKKCVLEVLDEVNVKFNNLDLKVRRKMVEELKFFIPQARHTPAFKLGRWDGTVSYCGVGGQSQINMLDRLLPIAIADGYEVEIDDKRVPYNFDFKQIEADHFAKHGYVWPENHPVAGEPVVLRDYQIEIINKYLENLQGIQEIATGAGKTLISAALSALTEKYGRSIVIVPNKSLVVQTEADYINLGLDVGVYFGERKEIGKTHTICTWQSLERLVKDGKGLPKDEQPINAIAEDVICIMVDEAHGAKANVLRQMLNGPFANIPIRWGLTGTVPKEDYNFMALLGSIGPVIDQLSAKTLQDKGILSRCHVQALQTMHPQEFGDFQGEYKFLTTDDERMEWLANSIASIAQTGNTLILVDRIACGDMLKEKLEKHQGLYKYLKGEEVPFISGSVKLADRQKEYDDVAVSDDKIIIASYGVAAVGINIPRIFNLVLIEPGKSFVRVIQSIGRGIRKAKDKDFVQIWDVCATTKYSRRHLTERKKFYKNAEYPCSVKKVKLEDSIDQLIESLKK